MRGTVSWQDFPYKAASSPTAAGDSAMAAATGAKQSFQTVVGRRRQRKTYKCSTVRSRTVMEGFDSATEP